MNRSAGWTGRVRRRFWGGLEAQRDVGFGQLKWVPLEEHHMEKIFKNISNLEADLNRLSEEHAEARRALLEKAYGRPAPSASRPPSASALVSRTNDSGELGLIHSGIGSNSSYVTTESSSRCDSPSSSHSYSDSSSSSGDSGSSCSSSD